MLRPDPIMFFEPSTEDCVVTKVIKDALMTVDIKLLDHIIIGGNAFFSFNQKGLL